MLEIGIPVYKAKKTLPKGLDSLVAQTKDNFIVCLSIDGDGEDYSEIIDTYTKRGLKIRVINATENGGPGIARQRILDTTQCDYIMFMDADDMLLPRAVQLLYTQAKIQDLDMVKSSFIKEGNNGPDKYVTKDANTVTWFHGKIYKVSYLKSKNICFLPDLRTDEDAYFNLVAWNSTSNRGELSEITYIWRYNSDSITRADNKVEYFSNTYLNYIRSQIEGLKKLYEINDGINNLLVGYTLINIYYYYMTALFLELPEKPMLDLVSIIKREPWIAGFLNDIETWKEIVQNIKSGQIFDDNVIFFYKENFGVWMDRVLT